MSKTHKIHVDQGLCDTARDLLKSGEAAPEDRIEAYRGGVLCLYGEVGKAAKVQVIGLKIIAYNPDAKRNRRED